MKRAIIFSSLLVTSICSFAQYPSLTIYHITSAYTSFPDAARDSGHTYKNVLYDAATHYHDNSVMIVVPKNLKADKKIDLVFWFHGWSNNIDSAAIRYKLLKQFEASALNAVLVFAETARNAPDSYGGKLENQNVFKELVNDVLQKLKTEKSVAKNCEPGNVVLAGHSGAYRVMANILVNGNVPVQEVILFDALYAETNKYISWIQSDPSHRFIDIYTDGGGTNVESMEMFKKLPALNISADTTQESDVTVQQLRARKIIFIHSLHQHNDVICDPDNFQFFLENTTFLKKLRK